MASEEKKPLARSRTRWAPAAIAVVVVTLGGALVLAARPIGIAMALMCGTAHRRPDGGLDVFVPSATTEWMVRCWSMGAGLVLVGLWVGWRAVRRRR